MFSPLRRSSTRKLELARLAIPRQLQSPCVGCRRRCAVSVSALIAPARFRGSPQPQRRQRPEASSRELRACELSSQAFGSVAADLRQQAKPRIHTQPQELSVHRKQELCLALFEPDLLNPTALAGRYPSSTGRMKLGVRPSTSWVVARSRTHRQTRCRRDGSPRSWGARPRRPTGRRTSRDALRRPPRARRRSIISTALC